MNSMTGFGRCEQDIGSSQFSIEIKSVNHRYLDVRFRVPSFLAPLEMKLAEKLRARFERGSFECNIRHRISNSQDGALVGTQFVIDEKALTSLKAACLKASKMLGTELEIGAQFLSQTGRVFVAVEDLDGLEKHQEDLFSLFDRALDSLAESRAREGDKIQEILLAQLESLDTATEGLTALSSKQPAAIREELDKRIKRWNLSQSVDSQRLETEIAFMADKADFTEEIDRLRAHIKEFHHLMAQSGGIGRKLDFYTQELHRELNTMGSKATLTEITQSVVTGKSIIEKLRQQVQNVE